MDETNKDISQVSGSGQSNDQEQLSSSNNADPESIVLSMEEQMTLSIEQIASENPLTREKSQHKFIELLESVLLAKQEEQSLPNELLENVFRFGDAQLTKPQWQQQMSGLFVIKVRVERSLMAASECETRLAEILTYLDCSENRIREICSDILASMAALSNSTYSSLVNHLLAHLNPLFLPFEQPQMVLDSQHQENTNSTQPQQHYKEAYLCEWQSPQGVYLEVYFTTLKKTFLKLTNNLIDYHPNDSAHAIFHQETMDITEKASLHVHKHIREAAVSLSLIYAAAMPDEQFKANSQTIADIIKRGLGDSYTQVRLQGVKACKEFLRRCLSNPQLKDTFIPQMIFCLCFNIHHPAQGLQAFTRQTWLELFPVGGREIVAANAEATTKYYIQQTYSRNHEIRQAACVCLSEMLSKVMGTSEKSKQDVRSLAGEIVAAVLNCSEYEEIALVREESFKCMVRLLEACGELVDADARWRIKEACSGHLWDQSIQVKSNAANVLAILFKQSNDDSYKKVYINEITDSLRDLLKCPLEMFLKKSYANEKSQIQQQQQQQQPQLKDSPAEIGNVGAGADGIAAIVQKRFIAEYFEGLVALTKETAYIIGKEPNNNETIPKLCGLITYNLRNIPFDKNENIKENIWRLYAEIITKTLPKKTAKELIEDVLDPVFKDFNNQKHNVATAAKYFIRELAGFIGPNILKGRIEQHGDMNQLDEYMKLGLL